MRIPNPNPFPIDNFPSIMKNAIQEVHTNTGFPIPLIAVSALGPVAAACQNSINVELPIGSVSPTSLFLLIIAESGEGKTPVDRLFAKSLRDFEENEAKKLQAVIPKLKAQRESWEIQRREILRAIKINRKNALRQNDPEENDLLDKEFEQLQQSLEDHLANEPKRARRVKIFHNDTTPAKMLSDLHEVWLSAYLNSDEAGSIFRSRAMADRGMINQLWDGATLTVDRISAPSFQVKDARLSISLAVQSGVLRDFLNDRATDFRSIGALARYLVACPVSTKGTRMLHDRPQFTEHLTVYQQRITAILEQDKLEMDNGRKERKVLIFSLDAKKYWFDFKNSIELDLIPGRYLSDIDDFASKITTNLARIAALFHHFEGHEGDISLETISRAGALCNWFIHQFKNSFSSLPEIPQEVADTYEMERFLWDWCSRHQGHSYILRSLVSQYGPNRLRGASGKGRRAYALDQLAMQGKIWLEFHGKKSWIRLNPQYFPVNVALLQYQSY
jgi:hypothetical protein